MGYLKQKSASVRGLALRFNERMLRAQRNKEMALPGAFAVLDNLLLMR